MILFSYILQVVPFTCFWEGDSTSLGMLVGHPRDSNGSPHLPLVVEQIMSNSWAQLAGIKPSDGLVSVGGYKLTAIRDLQVRLDVWPYVCLHFPLKHRRNQNNDAVYSMTD